jgi:hypothetical protein
MQRNQIFEVVCEVRTPGRHAARKRVVFDAVRVAHMIDGAE